MTHYYYTNIATRCSILINIYTDETFWGKNDATYDCVDTIARYLDTIPREFIRETPTYIECGVREPKKYISPIASMCSQICNKNDKKSITLDYIVDVLDFQPHHNSGFNELVARVVFNQRCGHEFLNAHNDASRTQSMEKITSETISEFVTITETVDDYYLYPDLVVIIAGWMIHDQM